MLTFKRINQYLNYFVIDRIRKVYNTIYYYLKGPRNFIVVNCSFKQWGDKLVNYNIGDDINFILLNRLTGRRIINLDEFYHPLPMSNFMAIGSIIDWKSNGDSLVWGSGVMESDTIIEESKKPKRILSVRGKLTQEYLSKQNIECPNVFGDPALLLPVIYNPRVSSSGKIGIIPHYADLDNNVLKDFLSNRGDVILIDIQNYQKWEDVIDLICSCYCVISSSLHGLILSDAYCVPNIWVKFSNKIAGNDFKFYDYFSSVGRSDRPLSFNELRLGVIPELVRTYTPPSVNLSNIMKSFPFELVENYLYLIEKDVYTCDLHKSINDSLQTSNSVIGE